jgi:hypothetical protein
MSRSKVKAKKAIGACGTPSKGDMELRKVGDGASRRRSISPILQLGPLMAMIHFHDELVQLIDAQDAEGGARVVEENFAEARVRIRLLLGSNR